MIILFILFGVVVGFLGGLFGIGGGTIAGPLLLVSLGYLGVAKPVIAQTAIFTTLAIVVCTSIVSAGTHWHYQRFLSPTFTILALGVVAGSVIGSFALVQLDGIVIKLLLGTFLLLIAYAMGVSNHYLHFIKNTLVRIPLGLVGILTGGLSAILGVGGGMLNTPVLMGRGVDIRKAIGISSGCGILIGLTAVTSSIIFAYLAELPALSYIYLPAFVPIAITAGFFANLGARTAQKIERLLLRRLFAIYLLLMGGTVLIEMLVGF